MFAFQLTPVVRILLISNVAIFALEYFFGFNLKELFALYSPGREYFQPLQIFTYCFLHANGGHLFSNMLGLFFFGPFIERQLSSKKFLQLYLFCGIMVGVLNVGVEYVELKRFEQDVVATMADPSPNNVIRFFGKFDTTAEFNRALDAYSKDPDNPEYVKLMKEGIRQIAKIGGPNSQLTGASGALFGLYAFIILILPNIKLQLLFPPIPITAKYLVFALAAFEVYGLMQNAPDDNVSHFSHLAGMLFAFILIKLVWKMKRVH